MTSSTLAHQQQPQATSLKSIINTPLKKFGFVALLLSQVFILGSPLLGGALGSALGLGLANTGGLIFATWLIGEVLFFGSLFILGKPVAQLCVAKFKLGSRGKEDR